MSLQEMQLLTINTMVSWLITVLTSMQFYKSVPFDMGNLAKKYPHDSMNYETEAYLTTIRIGPSLVDFFFFYFILLGLIWSEYWVP